MRWLMITRKLDPADDRTGFVMRWIETLAARLDHLDVICQEHANPALPANVTMYSMGKESGAGRIAQAWRFVSLLRRLTPEVDGIFCHMIPRYVLFGAPWARLHQKPLIFWYTHRHTGPELRVASRLASVIVTASAGSFPIQTPKLVVIGHGIDTDLFAPAEDENNLPEVVLVARLSRIKRLDLLLRATSRVMARGDVGPFRVVIAGGPVESEPDYPRELAALVESLDPAPDVMFTGPLPHTEIAARLRGCAVVVNLTPAGSFDKAVLEGMLTGKPTLVTNADFLPLLGDFADRLYLPGDGDEHDLADRLARLLRMTPDERRRIGAILRERTLQTYSLGGLMDRLVDLMQKASSDG